MKRRHFLVGSTLTIAGIAPTTSRAQADSREILRIGIVTDLHYADKPPRGTRNYRESLTKIEEANSVFDQEKIHLAVELGDFIDAADSVEKELSYLRTINNKFLSVSDQRHYVLGNHCVDTLTKEEFLGAVGQEKSYYSFDQAGFHFIILDACFRKDGEPYHRRNFTWTDTSIPDQELDWLRADLKLHNKPTFVFVHQRLDVKNDHGVENQVSARKLFEDSGNVRAVFQGHSHQNDLRWIHGIPYCTCVAMVEGQGEGSGSLFGMK